VDELGKELHMSRAQFFRKVNALTGQLQTNCSGFTGSKSCFLIESGQYNITAIMYEVGFQSTSILQNLSGSITGKILRVS